MCWLSKKTFGWWKIFAKGYSDYSPSLRGTGVLMLGFCWYELRHTLTAMSGAVVAWRVWIRKAKPYTAKGLSNNQKRQPCNDDCQKTCTGEAKFQVVLFFVGNVGAKCTYITSTIRQNGSSDQPFPITFSKNENDIYVQKVAIGWFL